ncbi:MFS transporter [Corynebacterium choanae]|uniref:Nitrate/nitrite transporter NarK n=1 Tax=Corynebacterium choanae TaxID=1862358 RepID=A0A3G6J662_9CORY|nr:MFS transporter [Corynebacterium choanae]AZA13429.1 Nitrate/nitrite transporter NarK [Corynebacterium choanae]
MTLDTSGRVLQGWNPEQPESWDAKIAWRTLIITTYSLFIGFTTWYLVSAIAPQLNQIGFSFSKTQLYWLSSASGLSAGFSRLLFMFLPPIIGTRKMVTISSFILALPMIGWFFAVLNPETPYWWMLVLSVAGGIGGGIFSGYMPSTGYFFPKAKSGTALGLQAGIGNFGVSFIQLVAPLLMGLSLFGVKAAPQIKPDGSEIWVHTPAIFMVPWTILAGVLAWVYLKDVPVKANFRQQMDIFGNTNTWVMTLIYLATFGAFSGFAAQFALMVNNIFGADSDLAATFPAEDLPKGAAFAFLGPLISAAMRAAWGPLCDKFGGAIWTFVSCAGMAVSTAVAALFLNPDDPSDFWWFLGAMLVMFFFTGLGNAGTFKQMPMIFDRRQAGGVIGWTAAIAAFGPFVVGVLVSSVGPVAFYWGCVVFFAICAALTWVFYARPRAPFPG